MPKKGYKAVTISEAVYSEMNNYIDKVNKEAGYRKVRSVTQFVEETLIARIRKGMASKE
jgi:hypothetical protein